MELSSLGIKPAKEKQFAHKGINTAEDLIHFLPRKYNDFTKETGILSDGQVSCIVVNVKSVKTFDNKMYIIMAMCTEKLTGEKVSVMWFNQTYMESKIRSMVGDDVYVVGKVVYNEQYKNYSISSPSVFTNDIKNGKRIYPVYSKIAGMSDEYLCGKIAESLIHKELMEETIPEHVIHENGLLSSHDALCELHMPTSIMRLHEAQQRMVFDDLLYFALRIEIANRTVSKGSQYNVKGLRITKSVISSLPYKLTDDQQAAVKGMIENMRNGRRVNALVQGDVGCGKSIVAFLVMLSMVDSGYQVALMAPTQVLAKQHYDDLCKMVEPFGVRVAFLGAGLKKSEKKIIMDGISSGDTKIVVGTHAVLGKDVNFKSLALVVTDEEHKFGVLQRQALVQKAASGVHSVTMSATPIPRSLAQVVYGNGIELYTIKQMPNGRLPVKTAITSNQNAVFKFLYKQISEGRQAYIVCPMIDKNEDMEGVKSVEEVAEIYKENFADKNGFTVATLSGRCSKDDTESIIGDFKNGKINILISTTVIEVGVNVPNASAIVIHNAERFGLSGLHQLRGRVGRGAYQSYCVLFSESKDNDRLNAMVKTCDGFKIAEEDLKLRGAGELIGVKQSGDDKYMSLMLAYPDKYKHIKSIAENMLDTIDECLILSSAMKDDSVDDE